MIAKNAIIAQPDGLVLFFLDCQTWTIDSTRFSFSCFFWTNNLKCAIYPWIVIGVIPFALLNLIKPLQCVDLWAKTSLDACSDLHILHNNTCDFTKSIGKPPLTTKNPFQIGKQLWGFQTTTYVSIVTSYETSSSNMLGACKCTLSTSEIDEDDILIETEHMNRRSWWNIFINSTNTLNITLLFFNHCNLITKPQTKH